MRALLQRLRVGAKAKAEERKSEAADPPPGPAASVTKTAPTKLGFRVTHPEKIVDPETGVTKQALIDYYLAVASLMLPHVTRPAAFVGALPEWCGTEMLLSKAAWTGNAAWHRRGRDSEGKRRRD